MCLARERGGLRVEPATARVRSLRAGLRLFRGPDDGVLCVEVSGSPVAELMSAVLVDAGAEARHQGPAAAHAALEPTCLPPSWARPLSRCGWPAGPGKWGEWPVSLVAVRPEGVSPWELGPREGQAAYAEIAAVLSLSHGSPSSSQPGCPPCKVAALCASQGPWPRRGEREMVKTQGRGKGACQLSVPVF